MGPNLLFVRGGTQRLRRLLVVRRIAVRTRRTRGTRAVASEDLLYRLVGDELCCLPGLGRVIKRYQEEFPDAGLQYSFSGGQALEPLTGRVPLNELTPGLQALTCFVGADSEVQRRSGFLCIPSATCIREIVRFVGSHFHRHRIFVAVANDELRYGICRDLVNHGVEVHTVGRRSLIDSSARVVVDRPYSLIGAHIEKADLFLAADPWRQVNARALRIACGARRWFALLPRDVRLTVEERRRLQSAYGFDELPMVTPTSVRRDVAVVYCSVKGGMWRTEPATNIVQSGVRYSHRRRHEVVCIADSWQRWQLTEGNMCKRVVLLAESVEHALFLARRLAGWKVTASDGVMLDGLSTSLHEAYRRSTEGSNERLIITPSATEQVDWSLVRVLINATGTAGLPPVPETALAKTTADHSRFVVVDCVDRWHPVLRRLSHQRKQAYRQASWPTLGQTISDMRVEEFVASTNGRSLR